MPNEPEPVIVPDTYLGWLHLIPSDASCVFLPARLYQRLVGLCVSPHATFDQKWAATRCTFVGCVPVLCVSNNLRAPMIVYLNGTIDFMPIDQEDSNA